MSPSYVPSSYIALRIASPSVLPALSIALAMRCMAS